MHARILQQTKRETLASAGPISSSLTCMQGSSSRQREKYTPLSLPLSSGSTSATALAAPVVVGTMLSAAARARRRSRWLASQQALVARVAVRGRHRALHDAELLVQHLHSATSEEQPSVSTALFKSMLLRGMHFPSQLPQG